MKTHATERISYWFRKPKRGDVVVFNTKGLTHPYLPSATYYTKRIVGLPGEIVRIVPPNLMVNGKIVKKPRIFSEIASGSNGFLVASGSMQPTPVLLSPQDEVVLGKNEYLTLGDNTASSFDGRYYGPISGDQIFGRISRIYWPLYRIENAIVP